jgi:uncharacterized membrane protein YgaE (UPF0421/DUF939 family)
MQLTSGLAQWKNAALTAFATTLCYWITLALHFPTGYWAAITCVVVMQSEVGATLIASRDRLIGTAVGALISWGALVVWHENLLMFGLATLVTVGICNSFNLQSAGRLAGVTVAIVMLIPRPGSAWQAASTRFLEVSLGVVVALVVTAIFSPKAMLMGFKVSR